MNRAKGKTTLTNVSSRKKARNTIRYVTIWKRERGVNESSGRRVPDVLNVHLLLDLLLAPLKLAEKHLERHGHVSLFWIQSVSNDPNVSKKGNPGKAKWQRILGRGVRSTFKLLRTKIISKRGNHGSKAYRGLVRGHLGHLRLHFVVNLHKLHLLISQRLPERLSRPLIFLNKRKSKNWKRKRIQCRSETKRRKYKESKKKTQH